MQYNPKIKKMKVGPKSNLIKANKLEIKRQMERINSLEKRVTCKMLLKKTNIYVSLESIRRHMQYIGLIYKKMPKRIYLTSANKTERLKCADIGSKKIIFGIQKF